ncbi:MAG: GNAT family N-acetyltransferase [Candidatus Bathyarchaeota archaeon]|nr:GNAT family N-acetyltransferase [Candidatus Bathyarchaeota archaeon]
MQIAVREMQPSEESAVESLFARSLGVIDRLVFKLSFEEAQKSAQKQQGGTLVAECDGKLVGAVSTRVQTIKGKQTGFVDALVADKLLRGRGVGKALVDGAVSWLEQRGCEVIYATADRYNSPSWNIFIHRGFRLYEVPRQLRDYRISFLRLWLVEFYLVGFGTFFLKRGGSQQPSETAAVWHWLAALFGVSAIWWIQVLRSQGPLMLLPLVVGVVAISLLAHEFSQKLVASRLGLLTTFKAWGSGILFSWLLALVGLFFPAYGSTYIKQLDWRYNPRKDKTGFFFFMGPLVSFIFALAFWVFSVSTSNGLVLALARVGYNINIIMVVFNLLPVKAAGGFVWDGQKILEWNKVAWFALVIATVALIAIGVII